MFIELRLLLLPTADGKAVDALKIEGDGAEAVPRRGGLRRSGSGRGLLR